MSEKAEWEAVVTETFWLGPTYEFRSGEWVLTAGIHGETGRLEWLLRHIEGGIETVSHSFGLEEHASLSDLNVVLDDLPSDIRADLVTQVSEQADPQLLSPENDNEGLA
jgi:hypothetical protein